MNNKALQVGGTLNPRRHLLIHREDVEQELFERLQQGEYCNILASRQVGKSSLMKQMEGRLIQSGKRVVDIDLAGDIGKNVSDNEWYYAFIEIIAEELKLDFDFDAWWEALNKLPLNQRLMRFCAEELFRTDFTPVIIFVDEIDVTLKLDFTDDFFTAIRTMYNERGSIEQFSKLNFCLVGVATPIEFIKDDRTTPYNVGHSIVLRDFDAQKDDLTPLQHALSKDKVIGKLLLDNIMKWTNGHPYLTIYICEAVIKVKLEQPTEIDSFVKQLFSDINQLMTDTHFDYILKFIDGRITDKQSSFSVYLKVLLRGSIANNNSDSYKQLKLVGLLKENNGGKLVVRNNIYKRVFNRRWALRSQPSSILSQRLEIGSVVVFLAFLTVGLFNLYDQHKAAQSDLIAQEWEDKLNTTIDPLEALKLYNQLSGKENNPKLGRPIAGYENRAQAAYDTFWQRQSEQLTREAQNRLTAFNKKANLVANSFQNSNSSSNRVQFSTMDFINYDEAIIYGMAAAIKTNSQPIAAVQDAYINHHYDVLTLTLRGHKGDVKDVAFSPDGLYIVTAGFDGKAILWDANNGRVKAEFKNPLDSLRSVLFAFDGKYIVTSTANGEISLFDTKTKQKRLQLTSARMTGIETTAISPNGLVLASTTRKGRVLLWTANNTINIGFAQNPVLLDYVYDAYQMKFSPNSQYLAIATANDTGIWDINKRLQFNQFNGYSRAVSFSKNGKYFARATADDLKLHIHSTDDLEQNTISFYAHSKPIVLIEFINDDRQIVSVSWDNSIHIWSTETGELLHSLILNDFQFLGLNMASLSPDKRHLITTHDDGTARVWDLAAIQNRSKDVIISKTPQALWQEVQLKLNLSLNEENQIVPLYPNGLRQLVGPTTVSKDINAQD